MKNLIYVLLAFLIVFSACEKDETNEPEVNSPQELASNFYPLKVGNKWIYQSYRSDSLDLNYESYSIDTIEVIGDTLVNGVMYYHVEGYTYGNMPYSKYLKVTDNYIVDIDGVKQLSILDNGEVLRDYLEFQANSTDTLYFGQRTMVDFYDTVNIALGAFETINARYTAYMIHDDFTTPHHLDRLYARDIGPIKYVGMIVSTLHYWKMELIDYELVN